MPLTYIERIERLEYLVGTLVSWLFPELLNELATRKLLRALQTDDYKEIFK